MSPCGLAPVYCVSSGPSSTLENGAMGSAGPRCRPTIRPLPGKWGASAKSATSIAAPFPATLFQIRPDFHLRRAASPKIHRQQPLKPNNPAPNLRTVTGHCQGLGKTRRSPLIAALAQISPAQSPNLPQPRAIGSALIKTKRRDTQTVLDDFRLSGSCRVLFPRRPSHRRDPALEAVLLNTSGGVTGGDAFETDATAGTGTALTLTTQAAERAYRSIDARPGRIRTRLTLHDGARVDWLPQETILFDGSALTRSLTIHMAKNARLLMVEPMIFGRTAMGETIRDATLQDHISLYRDGQLVFADRVRLNGDVQAHLDRPAIAGGARAMAAILLAAPNAESHLDHMRGRLPPDCGVSLIRDGLLFARLLASDGHALRQILIPVLRALRGADLPRTWML